MCILHIKVDDWQFCSLPKTANCSQEFLNRYPRCKYLQTKKDEKIALRELHSYFSGAICRQRRNIGWKNWFQTFKSISLLARTVIDTMFPEEGNWWYFGKRFICRWDCRKQNCCFQPSKTQVRLMWKGCSRSEKGAGKRTGKYLQNMQKNPILTPNFPSVLIFEIWWKLQSRWSRRGKAMFCCCWSYVLSSGGCCFCFCSDQWCYLCVLATGGLFASRQHCHFVFSVIACLSLQLLFVCRPLIRQLIFCHCLCWQMLLKLRRLCESYLLCLGGSCPVGQYLPSWLFFFPGTSGSMGLLFITRWALHPSLSNQLNCNKDSIKCQIHQRMPHSSSVAKQNECILFFLGLLFRAFTHFEWEITPNGPSNDNYGCHELQIENNHRAPIFVYPSEKR